MTAAAWDLQIEQGEDWDPILSLTTGVGGPALNLTGYSAHLQIRSVFYASTTLLDLSSAAGTIVLGGVAGTLQLLISDAASKTLTSGQIALTAYMNGRPVAKIGTYDLKLTNAAGTVTTLLGGDVWITPMTTVNP